MAYLKEKSFLVIALRDVERYCPATPPEDPLLRTRFP
jgi:hypothetical protein